MNWKELQQMAKEFDREARKERQDAGEHRADAVGLLTPALLRKHIKSGTDLVLAYGRKGTAVSYTVDDLSGSLKRGSARTRLSGRNPGACRWPNWKTRHGKPTASVHRK